METELLHQLICRYHFMKKVLIFEKKYENIEKKERKKIIAQFNKMKPRIMNQ